MLMYLHYRIRSSIDGTRHCIQVFDEFAQYLNDPTMETEIQRGVKTDRKKDCIYVFSTQATNMLKELQNTTSMKQNAKNQLSQLQQTYTSMNGITNMGNLVPNLRSNSNLPNDLSSLYNGSQTAVVRSKINQMSSALNGMSPNQAMQYLRRQEQIKAASDGVMTESIYNNQMRELQNMEQLTAAIKSASTPKEIADLQARIQTAQGEIQAEQEKINLIKIAQDSQQKLLDMQKQQVAKNSFYGNSDKTHNYPFPKITN